MDIKANDIEAIVRQVIANMGEGKTTPFPAKSTAATGAVPKSARVAMLTALEHYDIKEYPPKASVRIRTMSGDVSIAQDSFSVSLDTLLSGVLETVTDLIIPSKSLCFFTLTNPTFGSFIYLFEIDTLPF